TSRICRFCDVRDLRNYGVCCYRSVGSRHAATTNARRHTEDFVADGGADGWLRDAACGSNTTLEPGVPVGRHTHPGIESAYVLEGAFELPVQGQETRMLKAGDGVQIPPETPHAGGKASNVRVKILSVYVVEKGKPLASPA